MATLRYEGLVESTTETKMKLNKMNVCIVVLLLSVSLLLVVNLLFMTKFLLVANFAPTLEIDNSTIVMSKFAIPTEFIPREFLNESISLVRTKTFFRFSKVVGSNYVGNWTFETDVYLIGVTATSCASTPQKYEVSILPYDQDKPEIVSEYDENGNAWFNGRVYFYLRIDTSVGKVNDRFFLPYGLGVFVPKGEPIHFGLWGSAYGQGGSFTLYYIYPE